MHQKTYTFDEAFQSSLVYFQGDEAAARTWVECYALRDSAGDLCELTPDDMHRRIAAELARVEQHYDHAVGESEMYELLQRFRYLVPHPALMKGAGALSEHPLCDAFVLGLEADSADTFADYIQMDADQLQLLKRGCNVGQDLSVVHPRLGCGSVRMPAGLLSSMQRLSSVWGMSSPDEGNLLLTVAVNHPEITDFLNDCPHSSQECGARVSVRMEDVFIRSAIDNRPYDLKFPVYTEHPSVSQAVDAGALWKKLVRKSCDGAGLGILFWDTILRESVSDCYADRGYRTRSVSPYGELPMSPFEACPMFDINLLSYVENPFTDRAMFDFERLRDHAMLAMRLADDAVDLAVERVDAVLNAVATGSDSEPLRCGESVLWQKIRTKMEQGRRVGIGTTGGKEMLAAMGLRLGTEEATAFAESIHKAIALACYRSSVQLAVERGKMPVYDTEAEKNNPFVNRIRVADPALYEDMARYGRRNIACLSIFPNGNLANMLRGAAAPEYASASGEERIMAPNVGENDWFEQVRMQGRIQRWVDQSVALEVCLPADASDDLVSEVYHEAWRCGCKSCRINRAGGAGKTVPTQQPYPEFTPIRPRELDCDVVRFQNNKEKWIAFVGLLNGRPYEIFTGLVDDEDGLMLPKSVNSGKIIRNVHEDTGIKTYDFQFTNKYGYKITIEGLSHKFNPEYWNYAKLISGVMRYGMPIDQVVRLVGSLQLNSESINNWKVGVERALKKYVPEDAELVQRCPNCGEKLVLHDGQAKCIRCGYNRTEI
ncbi:MAG: ribonucleoside-diphosphate reductase, adenosylcobalamin-dependent [Paludibacteraceae bacterium]|nr:ribonucleoside-diphosphate reductase, adenosylcobalamin-dependent [Paludibacteraceae bacterium]